MKYYRLSNSLRRIGVSFFALVFCLGLLLPASSPVLADISSATVSLTTSDNTTVYGEAVTFTATISPGEATGKVNFVDGSIVLGNSISLNNGKASKTVSNLMPGTHTISAQYLGDDNFTVSTSSAVTQTVSRAGTTVGFTVSPLALKKGDSVTYTATISVSSPGAGNPTGIVTFKEGTTTLGTGTVSNRIATFTKSNVFSGSHTVTAEYNGDYNFNSSTKNLTFTVSALSSAEGFAWAWGNNDTGQLGNNSTTDTDFPVLVKSSSSTDETLDGSVNMVSAGNLHSLAVLGKNLYSWGDNSQGQLGRDSSSSTRKYAQSVDLPSGSGNPKGISAGYQHSLLCDSNGNVYAWGDDSKNQLGNILKLDEDSPVKVSGEGGSGYLSNIIAVSAGWQHSLALKSDGTVWAWGDNSKYQLGNGTTYEFDIPFQVSELSGIIAIAAGQYHSLALASNGIVYAWGYNNKGQLGDGTTTNRSTPVQVIDLTGITAIAAGDSHNLAIKSDGTVWSWGSNSSGQLGDSSSTTRNSPVQVRKGEQEESSTYLDDIAFIAAGSEHSLALDSVGTVWAWGNNEYGQLGNRSIDLDDQDYNQTPVRVDEFDEDSGNGAEFIAAGGNHCLAVFDTDLYIYSTSLKDGEDGDDYSYTLKARAGNYGDPDEDEYSSSGEVECTWEEVYLESREYTLSDLGLELDKDTGEIHGDSEIDADEDDYYFTFRAISKEGDSEGTSAIKSFVLTVKEQQEQQEELIETSTILTSSLNPSIFGQSVTFTATITPLIISTNFPTGIVIFVEDDTLLKMVSLNEDLKASFSTSNLSEGSHNITAIYCGNSKYYNSCSDILVQQVKPAFRIDQASLPYGDVKINYSEVLTASSGTLPYTWSIVKVSGQSLPKGLKLNSKTGEIYGKPTKAGSYDFTVQVKDKANQTILKGFRIIIYPAVTLSAPKPAKGEIGYLYQGNAPKASGGDGDYIWTISKGKLPDGLELDNETGIISGVPDEAGIFKFTLAVRDGPGSSASKNLSITIYPRLEITTLEVPSADIGVTYSATLKATGGTKKYTWSIVEGDEALPPGLTRSKGTIKGKAAEDCSGIYSFTIKVDDGIVKASRKVSIRVNLPLEIITLHELPDEISNGKYCYYKFEPEGGSEEGYKWSKSGSLPKGLNFEILTEDSIPYAVISGTVSKVGKYNFKIKLTDSLKGSVTLSKTVTVKKSSSTTTTTTTIKPIVIKLAPGTAGPPPSMGITLTATEMAKILEKRTNGRVRFEIYWSQSLAKSNELVNAVQTNVANMAYLSTYTEPTKLPLSAVGELPGIFIHDWVGCMAYNDLIHQNPVMAELKKYNLRPYYALNNLQQQLISNKPIRELAQVKGKKVSASGVAAIIISGLGAVPIAMSPVEQYEALQKGTIDACSAPKTTINDFKLYEVGKYLEEVYTVPRLYPVVFNQDFWNSLPSDIKKIFEDAVPDLINSAYDCMDVQTAGAALNEIQSANVEVIKWSDADIAGINKVAAAYANQWATDTDAKGLPGTKVVSDFRAAVSQYESLNPYK